MGKVTVDGPGSKWTNSGDLSVGSNGNGSLNISEGGAVSNGNGYIGYSSSSKGNVMADGIGSTWTNNSLYVGVSGTGMLNIAGGGAVAATSVSINSKSLLAIDVENDSLLNIGGGSGTITNKGTVRLLAGASAVAGTPYSPIAAGIWTGTGTYRAVGGKWNATSHTFAASAVQEIQPGVATSIVLDAIQRVMINDVGPDGSRWSAGVSFVPSSGTATVTASAIGSDATAVLDSYWPNGCRW